MRSLKVQVEGRYVEVDVGTGRLGSRWEPDEPIELIVISIDGVAVEEVDPVFYAAVEQVVSDTLPSVYAAEAEELYDSIQDR
jgi:hypothetical protein